MKSAVAGCLIVAMTSVSARAQTAPAPTRSSTDAPLRARLTEDVIKAAVRESLANDKQDATIAPGKALSADPRYQKFGSEMSEAKIPDCLHGDALKFQPTYVFVGLLAIPFWALAAVRGKCR